MSVLSNVQKGFNSCDEIERERNIARRVKTEQMLENTSTRRGWMKTCIVTVTVVTGPLICLLLANPLKWKWSRY